MLVEADQALRLIADDMRNEAIVPVRPRTAQSPRLAPVLLVLFAGVLIGVVVANAPPPKKRRRRRR